MNDLKMMNANSRAATMLTKVTRFDAGNPKKRAMTSHGS